MRYLNARVPAVGEDRKVYSTVDSSASAGQTIFNVSYDQGRVAVFLNGIRLVPVQDYTYTLSGIGSNVTLASGIVANDYLELIGLQGINTGNAVTEDNFVVGTASTGSGGGYTNSTTVFPVSSSTGDLVSVWRNGIKLVPTTDFTVNATASTVTLQSASNTDDEITVHVVGILQHSNFVQTTGGTFTGTVAHTGDITFGDNNKAKFGAGNDLQIYHDGSNSYVDDAGTGRLYLRGNDRVQIQKYTGEDMVTATVDDGVKLYHDNAKRIETTSTGIAITGGATATGNIGIGTGSTTLTEKFRVDGAAVVTGQLQSHQTSAMALHQTTSAISEIRVYGADASTAGSLRIRGYANDGSPFYEGLAIDSSGNCGIGITTPSSFDSAGRQLVVGSGTGSQGLTIYAGSSNTGVIHFADGTTGNESYRGWVYYSHNFDRMELGTAADTRVTIASSGNVGVGTTNPATQLEIEGATPVITVDTTSNDPGIQWARSGTVGYQMKLNNANLLYFYNSSTKLTLDATGHLNPGSNNAQDLGSSSLKWRNIYTGDIHLSNEESGNDVDGTSGNWTIQEGSEDLFLINNKSGKQYKFKLEEV